MSSFIDFKSFLVSVLGDFSGFWGSDGLPGSPVGALGLPWGPNVTPKRLPRGSGGGFGCDFGLPGVPLESPWDCFWESLGNPWDQIHGSDPWIGSMDPIHGSDPWIGSMDRSSN